MRISDWSSDVCSSDLPGLVKGIDRRAIRRLKRQVMPPGQLAQRRFAVLGRHEQFVIPEIIAKLAAERNAEHVEDRVVECATGLDVGDDHLDMIDQPAAMQQLRFHRLSPVCESAEIRRSEEHTSELQSLMRISYAVFCLK